MFKRIIAPIQQWMLAHGQCVGCGTPLSQGLREQSRQGTVMTTCRCGRMYIYNPHANRYRRALISEVQ